MSRVDHRHSGSSHEKTRDSNRFLNFFSRHHSPQPAPAKQDSSHNRKSTSQPSSRTSSRHSSQSFTRELSRNTPNSLPLITDLDVQVPSESPTRSPVQTATPLHRNIVSNGRSSNPSGVSFSPTVRFNRCRQRGNLAVPRDDVEWATAGITATAVPGAAAAASTPSPARRYTLHARSPAVTHVSEPPGEDDVTGAVGRRLVRRDAFIDRRKNSHLDGDCDGEEVDSTDVEVSQGIVVERTRTTAAGPATTLTATTTVTRVPSPVNSLHSFSDGSASEVSYRAPPSLVGVELPAGTPQPNLPTATSAANRWSPDVDVLSLSESSPRELRRVDAVCIRAAAPSAGHTSLASRLVYGRRDSSNSDNDDNDDSLRQRDRIAARKTRTSKTKSDRSGLSAPGTRAAQRCISSDNFADVRRAAASTTATAASLNDEESTLQHRRYAVDVSTMNLPTVGGSAPQRAKTEAAVAAEQQRSPPRPSRSSRPLSRNANRRAAKSEVASEAGRSSFHSVASTSGLIEYSYFSLPGVAPTTTTTAASPSNAQHSDVMTVELLRDEDAAAARHLHSTTVAPASRNGQGPRRMSVVSTRSDKSTATYYSYSLPTYPTTQQDKPIPAPPANSKPITTAATTDTSATAAAAAAAAARRSGSSATATINIRDLSSSDFEEIVRGGRMADTRFTTAPAAAASPPTQPPSGSLPAPSSPQQPQRPTAASNAVRSPKNAPPVPFSVSAPGSSPDTSGGVTSAATTAAATAVTADAFILTPMNRVAIAAAASLPGSPQRQPSRRLSEVNAQPLDNHATGAGSGSPSHPAARTILRQITDEEGDHRNPLHHRHSSNKSSPPTSPQEGEEMQMRVLHGSRDPLFIQAPVHPSVNLPRWTVSDALLQRHSGDGTGNGQRHSV